MKVLESVNQSREQQGQR